MSELSLRALTQIWLGNTVIEDAFNQRTVLDRLALAITGISGSGVVTWGVAPTFPSGVVLTAPTIADFTNAGHGHQGASGGGTLDAAALASGTLGAGRMPALTGDVTTSVGSVATTIGAGKVTNAMLAGSIDLTAKVTGVLPVANGGTGLAFFGVAGPASSVKTFTFPNASAAVLTDNAAVTVAQGGTGRGSGTAYAVVCGGTTSTAAQQSVASVGTSGQVLTSNGAGTLPTFQTPAAAVFVPTITVATDFEATGRYTITNTGGGAATVGTIGLQLATSATATSGTSVAWQVSIQGNSGNPMSGSPSMGMMLEAGPTFGTDFTSFFGLGNLAATGGVISYTPNHIGFKIVRAASGTTSLYATQADGTTETASSALTTLTAADDLALAFKVNGTSSVDYYYSVNQGAWSSATNLTTNLPTTAVNWSGTSGQFIISNAGVATATTVRVYGATFSR